MILFHQVRKREYYADIENLWGIKTKQGWPHYHVKGKCVNYYHFLMFPFPYFLSSTKHKQQTVIHKHKTTALTFTSVLNCQIAYLENLLKMYNDEIHRLQKSELSLDDLDLEDSSFIHEHKLKRKVRTGFPWGCTGYKSGWNFYKYSLRLAQLILLFSSFPDDEDL